MTEFVVVHVTEPHKVDVRVFDGVSVSDKVGKCDTESTGLIEFEWGGDSVKV